ncbi:MAG TPA: DUF1206 domain-containing protein [Ktedonobacteraceae bacterium]|nr:DUF1206 domain-containing protein [Ktedonobacteraceae bacterium]
MRPNVSTATRNAHRAEYAARGAATSRWMTGFARLGYAAKGVVYLIIGGLALELAIGHGGAATDQRGALQTIYEQPFGKFLLIVVGIGLAGYALWSFIQAIFDTEGKGRDAKGILARIGYGAVGVAYALIAFGAFQLALGTGSVGQHSSTSTQDWTARLLKLPFGQAVVVIVGLIVLGIAFYLFAKAWNAKFQNRLALSGVAARLRRWIVGSGRLGYGALGVVFTIIGFFLIVAALQHNPSQAKGLDTALQELLRQPFGPVLLGIVAFGLFCYGIYSLVEARYRRVGR